MEITVTMRQENVFVRKTSVSGTDDGTKKVLLTIEHKK